MTKQKKKKQVVIPFERSTNSSHVVINKDDFIDILNYDNDSDDKLLESIKLLKLLLKGTSLIEQQKDILSKKSLIRSSFMIDNNDDNSQLLQITLESLIYLYISPDYSVIRKSLDWIVDIVIKSTSLSLKDKRKCIRNVFYRLQSKINVDVNDINIDKVMNFTLSLNCIVMLDKETMWLDEESNIDSDAKHVKLCDDSIMFQYVSKCNSIFQYCAKYIITGYSVDNVTYDKNDQYTTSIGVEIIRYAECCGECLRGIMTALKSRLNIYIIDLISGSLSLQWSLLIQSMMASSCHILSSQYLHKDIITQTAMFAIYLQWICRYSYGISMMTDKSRPGIQLIAILNILDDDNYNLNEEQINATVKIGVDHGLVQYSKEFPPVSRFALIRGILSVFDDASLLFCETDLDIHKITPEVSVVLNMMNDKYKINVHNAYLNNFTCYCYEIIKVTCSSQGTSDRQIYGLQILEAWLTRLYSINIPYDSLQEKFQFLSTLLIRAWSHPYKQLNHLAPNIYQKLIDTIHSYQQKLDVVDSSIWKHLINEALSRSAEHRSRYQALTILLPKIGAKSFMETRSSLLDELVRSITFRDVCVSVSSFIGVLLRSYVEQLNYMGLDGVQNARELWLKPIVGAICSHDARIRINAVDYLIPDILKLDQHCGCILMETIRTLVDDKNLVLWGLVNVCSFCRLYGLPGQEIVCIEEPKVTSNLNTNELIWSCISDDDELRLRGLNLISTSQKTAAPLEGHELMILRKVFKYNLKSGIPDHRHRICRTLKAIVFRVSEAHRVAARDLKKIEIKFAKLKDELSASINNNDQESSNALKSKIEDINSIKLQLIKNVTESHEVFDWLRDSVLENLYPGTTYDRELMALDIIDSIIEVVGTKSPLLDGLFTAIMTNTFLNLLISSWDRTRSLAAELLTKFPYPLPSYNKRSEVKKLLDWATKLAGSVRQRESDAGALMIKVVFSIYCLNLGWDNLFKDTTKKDLAIAIEDPRQADVSNLLKAHLQFCRNNTPAENVYALDVEELVSPDITVIVGRVGGNVVAVGALRKIDDFHAELKSMHIVNQNRSKGHGTILVQWILDFARSKGYSRVSLETGTSDDYAHARALYKKFNFTECPPFGYYESSEISVCMTLEFKDELEITCTKFLNSLSDTLELRLESLDKLLRQVKDINDINSSAASVEEKESTPLCHGLLMAIRYCLEVAADKKMMNSQVWPPLIRRILHLATESLRIAMTVVAESPSDAPFAPVIGSYNTAASSSTMSASYINTNSVMGAGTENDIIDEKGSEVQRAVVGAWLLVKEASAMLASLVKISPPSKSKEDEQKMESIQSLELLSFSEIKTVGATILDALGRLKHMGAIAEAHSALQTISECLLRHGERSPQLCRLPSVWLNEILERLKNERQVFILRRSAGFAYSFLSILRSEPANALPLLLQTAMSNLLTYIESNLDDIAENASCRIVSLATSEGLKGSWRGCVHALNVIRLILIDGSLGKELDSYIARATQLAVIGFSSNRWAVRNSSMMVFSAVIQRAVNHDKNGSGGSNAITVSDFFHRYPILFPFLLSELATITSYKVIMNGAWPLSVEYNPSINAKEHTIRGAQEGGLHPSLYPILLLVAKLRSPLYREDMKVNSDNNIDLFVPLIMSCRSQKFQKVREMAAKAFIPLVPIADIPATAASILSNLLLEITTITTNDLHGNLLLVDGILQNLYDQIDESKLNSIKEMETHVFPHLVRVVEFIRLRDCPPVSIVFLRILKTALGLVGLNAYKVLYSFCQHFWIKIIKIDELPISPCKPYEPLLLKDSLHILTTMTIEIELGLQVAEVDNILNSKSLLRGLRHGMSEVREGIVTGFLQCISIEEGLHISDEKKHYLVLINNFFSKVEVLSEILNAACLEKEPDVMQLFFEFLCQFVRSNPLLSLTTDIKQLFLRNWDNLNKFLLTANGALSPTIAASSAVEILGWIIALLGNKTIESELSLEQVVSWQDLVEKACCEENPSSLRESVARSIEASNILTVLSMHATNFKQGLRFDKCSTSAYDHKLSNLSCRLWLVALTLMQDDDDDIRSIANKAVAPALEVCNDNQHPKDFLTIGTYSIDMMVDNISLCIVYSTLSRTDTSISMGVQAIINELFIKSGDLVQLQNADNELDKIFQAEQWNVFIEANVCTNILSKAIGKALQLLVFYNKQSYMTDIIQKIIVRSSEVLVNYHDLDEGDQWIGGILLQKDIFGVIYSTLFTIQEIMTSLNNDEKNNIEKLLKKIKLFSSDKVHPKTDIIIKNIYLNM